jgi:uncharacterized membrane protein
LFGEAPSVAQRFRTDPTSFYEIGRLWVILLSVATIPLLFLVARRAFDDVTGLVAALGWALVPLAVGYGSIVRTDAPGTCFGLLALWACLLAFDRPTTSQFALAGAAIGLAVASRYFMLSLLPVLAAVWLLARRRDRVRVPLRTLVVGAAAALAVFAVTTPFFFVDWHAVARSLQAETVGTVTNDQSGWLDNIGYYLGDAIPAAVWWIVPLFAVVGLGIACSRRDVRRLLLAGFMGLFAMVISLSSLHWQRWIIPVLPLVVLFGASATVTTARLVARSLSSTRARRWTFAGAAVIGAIALTAAPAVSLVEFARAQDAPSSRVLMRNWITTHLPKGSLIATEVKGPELRTAGYRVLERYDLPTDGTLGDYAAHGYHYLIVNLFVSSRYRSKALHFQRHARFYGFLRERGRLLAEFGAADGVEGPHLKLYYMNPAVLAAPHRPINVVVTSRSHHDRLTRPKPLYPIGEEILGEPGTAPSTVGTG